MCERAAIWTRKMLIVLNFLRVLAIATLCTALLCTCAVNSLDALRYSAPLAMPIPPPSQVHPREYPAQASFADITLGGADYDASLPNQRIEAEATELWFHSDWDRYGDTSSSALAYAIYAFSPGYSSGQFSIITSWSNPPDNGNLYLGVADYPADKWRWYPIDQVEPLVLENISSYLGMHTQLLIAVMLLDTALAPPPPDPKLSTITLHEGTP